MRCLVVGGGWYGCHLTRMLLANKHHVTMIYKDAGLFKGSSARNQNRLHLGLHYPRSFKTRIECQNGFAEFMKQYAELTEEVPRNIYLVADDSLLDFETFCVIYKDAVELERLPLAQVPLIDPMRFQGAVVCKERQINFNKAKLLFETELQNVEQFNLTSLDEVSVIGPNDIRFRGMTFDCLLDCTYSQSSATGSEVIYELCLTLIYKLKEPKLHGNFALTIMDGDFFSLYPVNHKPDGKYFTLTDVLETPCFVSSSFEEVSKKKEDFSQAELSAKRTTIEQRVLMRCPAFLSAFEYSDYWLSFKTKFNSGRNAAADRSVSVEKSGSTIRVFGGKITGIFDAAPIVLDLLNQIKP